MSKSSCLTQNGPLCCFVVVVCGGKLLSPFYLFGHLFVLSVFCLFILIFTFLFFLGLDVFLEFCCFVFVSFFLKQENTKLGE